ncbi:MAG: ABC transporter permease [Chloroflexi bacterium]|nr:ABC transporter permease [Chloroflexota bacterium]
MAQITHEIKASYAFVERNFNLIKRYWGWEVVWLLYSIVNALAITFIGKASGAITGRSLTQLEIDTAILYLLVGTLVWHYLSVIFHDISEAIAWERWEGTIEYTFMAPVTRFTHMMGQTAFCVIYGVLRTGVVMLVVSLFFRLDLNQANVLGSGLVLLAGSLSFIGLGVTAAVLPLLFPERGAQMTHALQALVLLVSGVYYPISVLPTWLQPVARLSPATYVLEGMRAGILEGASTAALLRYVWPLLLMGVIFIPLGVYIFRLAERYAKRAGKLTRSG